MLTDLIQYNTNTKLATTIQHNSEKKQWIFWQTAFSSDDSASLKQKRVIQRLHTRIKLLSSCTMSMRDQARLMQTSNWMLVSAPTCFLKHHQPVLGVQKWFGLQKLKSPWACAEVLPASKFKQLLFEIFLLRLRIVNSLWIRQNWALD